ncbi:MAG: toprim domain-containing protein [Sphingomonadaceae bacterium]|nr:toprim domain-containing protein [Sphingomonadaceae bacterium]
MPDTASELARRLARDAEAVCRHYLSNGRREGRYWLIGDVENSPGRSLYVRLRGPESGKGAAGKWQDAADGQHGDLLDLIAANQHLTTLRDTLDEARRFLSLPRPERREDLATPATRGSPEAARRLWAISKPVRGTTAEAYLRSRGLNGFRDCTSLRYHPRCFYRPDRDDDPDVRTAWPALIAAVVDLSDTITGVHRTWLDPGGGGKAPIVTPRRAMGDLLGYGVRFGHATDTMATGEGIETMLSLRQVAPTLPSVAALSAAHLAALILPPTLRRLYIAEEADSAGQHGARQLAERAEAQGIEARPLTTPMSDLNAHLIRHGAGDLRALVRVQLAPEDVSRFLHDQVAGTGVRAA